MAGVAPTPFASTIAANELLARPESIDWNGDGSIDADDEWIEIYNSSQSRVDLSGWHLSATDGRSTTTYTFPAGTTIAGRSYRVFYGNQTKVRLGASGEVRLLYPDRRVADIVRYPELGPDQSFVKSSDRGRTWTRDCIPSPHAPNCSAGATLTTTFNLSFFEKHIADASLITAIDQAVLATNALFAIILALIAGFFGNLLNAAIASPGAHVRQILGSLGALAERFRQVRLGLHARAPSRLLFWVGTPIKLSALFLGYGFIFAFLDPALDLREVDSWLLIFALAISVGILSVSVFAAQQLVLRQYGRHAHWRVRTGAIFLVLVTTVFSRLAGFVPGVLIAGPTGFEARQNPDLKIKLNLMAIGALVFVGLAMWVLAPLVDADAWFKTVVLLTFAAAVQTLFLELLPFENLHGRALFDSNRLAWFILFALTTLVLMQTMLNPDGSSLAAFQSPTMSVFSLVVALFALTSVIVSLYVHTPGNSRTDAIEREEGPKPL